jgi:hypothetical protein
VKPAIAVSNPFNGNSIFDKFSHSQNAFGKAQQTLEFEFQSNNGALENEAMILRLASEGKLTLSRRLHSTKPWIISTGSGKVNSVNAVQSKPEMSRRFPDGNQSSRSRACHFLKTGGLSEMSGNLRNSIPLIHLAALVRKKQFRTPPKATQ